jgi:hypothetical protein
MDPIHSEPPFLRKSQERPLYTDFKKKALILLKCQEESRESRGQVCMIANDNAEVLVRKVLDM